MAEQFLTPQSEQIIAGSGDQVEQVIVTAGPGYEQRQEVVENVTAAHNAALSKTAQMIWLMVGLLMALIAGRVFLMLIGANPQAPFAGLVYTLSDIFLWPFYGLIPSPAVGNLVLEISSLIAIVVYGVAGWALIRLMWLVFSRRPTRKVTIYEREQI